MDLEASATVEEVSLEGLHLDTDVIYREQRVSSNGCKKRKPEELLDPNSSNEKNELCEEILKKRKRENPITVPESMVLKQATDDLDLMCKIWVMELRRLPLDQQLFARKAVCDVLFEARLGQLTKDSVRINRSDVVQNYLTCVHEEHGKICACLNSSQRCPSSSSQMYPWHFHCYGDGGWKGNLFSPHRPSFLATYYNKFPPHCILPWGLPHYREPRIGRPVVITTAMNITTSTIVVVTPRLIGTTAPSASPNSQLVSTKVNMSPCPVENPTITYINAACNLSFNQPINSPVVTTSTSDRSDEGGTGACTSSSIPSNNNNASDSILRIQQSTKPTVNTSTTPTVYTLCDVHMDTVTTDK